MTKYVCIDTNIFVQCCVSQLDNRDTIEALAKVLEKIERNEFVLLLPEVIQLEVPKVLKKKMPKITEEIKKLQSSIRNSESPEPLKKELIESIDQNLASRNQGLKLAQEKIEAIFSHENTKLITLSPDIIVDSYRIFLTGQKPVGKEVPLTDMDTDSTEKKRRKEEDRERARGGIQADAVIVASLKHYLALELGYEFYLCSSDLDAFGKENGKQDSELHSEISKHFKDITFFTNLARLLNDKFSSNIKEEIVEKLEPTTEASDSLSGSVEKTDGFAETL